MTLLLAWTMDRHQMMRAAAGEARLLAWCSAPGHGHWEMNDRGQRSVLACGRADDIEQAKAAAESAARDYAKAILAALPRPEPTAGEVDDVGFCLFRILYEDIPLASRRSHWDSMPDRQQGAWEAVARAAIAAGLDPSRLKEGT